MKTDVRRLMKFAEQHCREAGKITLQYFQQELQIEYKEDASPVTIADRKSEELIRRAIEKEFPGHAIVGEEFGETLRNSDCTWYIDPIDGTLAYTHGVPIYGVMLGLRIAKEFVVGCVFLPAINELVIAGKGEGCYWNGKKASASKTHQLSDALFAHSGSEYFSKAERGDSFRRLEAATSLQRTWGDCFGHILVATGRADICVDAVLFPWDSAPLIPILQEAGGTFTDWKGNVTNEGGEGISTNGFLLQQVLAITSV
jgi:histidinol-phosphatase